MKKFNIALIMALFSFTAVQAESGINIGVSLQAGVFEVDGAKEDFATSHVSNNAASASISKKTASEQENAEGLFAIASIFVEKTIGDRFAVGIDYVPHSMDSETSENVQQDSSGVDASTLTNVTNTVQVDFEDLTTAYVTFNLNENIYVKAGYMEVDVITNEKLATGGNYGNTSLDGHILGVGYNYDLPNGVFFRGEANHMDLGGATLKNTVDTDKSVSVDGISGYGARISVGKSF